jgi:regulatory protein
MVARPLPPVPEDPDEAARAAYAHGLRLLSGRELSEAAMRTRLAARGFADDAVDAATARLVQVGALSDQRAVKAVARTLVLVKRRGRLRARRELELKGFRAEDAATAVAELVSDDDEREAIERALDARLRARPAVRFDTAAMTRLYAFLIRKGFAAGAARDAVRRRFRTASLPDDAAGEEDR